MVNRIFACCVAAVVAAAASGAVALSAPSADGAYATLAERYFREAFRDDPVNATSAGVHDFDATLGDHSARSYAMRISRDRRYLGELAGLSSRPLGKRAAFDSRLLENQLQDDILLLATMQTWRHNADDYVSTASGGVFALIDRPFAPARIRLRNVIARENALPRFFRQAEQNLTSVDAETAQIAADDADGAAAFFSHDVPAAFAVSSDPSTRRAFVASTHRAVDASRAFASWLRRGPLKHPRGSFAIGPENYAARLHYEEGVDLPLSEYERVGEAALARTHAEMILVARRIDPHADVRAVLARLAHRHPASSRLLSAAQSDLVRLRSFDVTHNIITLPRDATISVTTTPPFERSTTVAQMDSPGPLERHADLAHYNVTPVNTKDSKRDQEGYLAQFNDFERPIISAHEVYPGHFVNFAIDRHLPLTLTEKLVTASSFSEGWAHYCEQMIVDEGWGNGDPRVRLAQLREAIWRNARYVVGVQLHTRGMTVPQAVQFFQTQAFLDPADARIEARRGTQDATYGYYTLGKLEILKLRADYKKKMGAAYTLRRFHDALLSYGDPPFSLLRPLLLGDDDDGRIL